MAESESKPAVPAPADPPAVTPPAAIPAPVLTPRQRLQALAAKLREKAQSLWMRLLPKVSAREQKALDKGSDWSPRWLSVFALGKTPDGPTRRGVALYALLSAGLIAALVGGSWHLWRKTHERRAHESSQRALEAMVAAEEAEDAAEVDDRPGAAARAEGAPAEADDPELLLAVGTFTIELSLGSHLSNGDFDLVLRVDSPQTKAILAADPVRTRDVITAALRPMERDLFLSREGKARLKRTILDRLNGLLKSGRVREAYFPNYLVH